MSNLSPFVNQLLIAMPSLHDPNFTKSVIYLCEHHEQGSVGLIINKPNYKYSLFEWPKICYL
jgi:putative transcriptional regulator